MVKVATLVNSSFKAEKPLLTLMTLARQLGIWPSPPDSYLVELLTAGGPVRNYLAPNQVYLLAGDKAEEPIICDATTSKKRLL